MVDGARLQLFELPALTTAQTQSAAYADKEGDADARLRGRFPITAGPHTVAVAFLKKPSVLSEAARQPFFADYNGRKHGRGVLGLGRRALQPRAAPATRRAAAGSSVCTPACSRQTRRHARGRSCRRWRGGRTGAPSRRGSGRAAGVLQGGARRRRRVRDGIEMALRALLVSPQFLFRIERDPAGIPAEHAVPAERSRARVAAVVLPLEQHPRRGAARRGHARHAAAAGGARAAGAPHARRSARRRAGDELRGQWLHLRNLSASNPDPRLFPDFDDNLRQAFRRETELFFDSIKREDRSVLDLLRADYTFVNERLAKHYGIPNVYGSHFRRVTLPKDSPRAACSGTASILTVTSYGDRTSPVQRGKWILENLLGLPPPPPPPNVPPLKERVAGGKVLTMRERMAQHRENPACAGCHKLMDPIGLATENFDAVGRWRTLEDGMPVDASGGLPDGATFDGIDGLRDGAAAPAGAVRGHADREAAHLCASAAASSRLMLRRCARSSARSGATDYRFSSLILGVVNSAPFQMRRSQ